MTFKEKLLALDQAICKEHANAVASGWFQITSEKALLECSAKWAKDSSSEAGHFKTQGAFEFLEVFCAISRPTSNPVRKDLDNLK